MATEDEELTGRTVRISGDTVKSLRKAKLWSPERLASAAKCSVKTIKNIEKSKEVYIATLEKIAIALGVKDPATLMFDRKEYRKESIGFTANLFPTELELIYEGDLQELDETDELRERMRALKQRSGLRGKFIIIAIKESKSFAVVLELTNQDCLGLLDSFVRNSLDSLGVKQVRIPVEPVPNSPVRLLLSSSHLLGPGLFSLPLFYQFSYKLFIQQVQKVAGNARNYKLEIKDGYANINKIK